jgi:hypothetical protein
MAGDMRFEVFTVVKNSIVVFWDTISCTLVCGYQRYEAICFLHLQGSARNAGNLEEYKVP